MREYGKVSPQFWIGETGRMLRGDTNAQLLALYLMTCPHSTMTGVFHCPILYMAHETGIGVEGAAKALLRLSEVGFCEYEDASETVFVVRMAAYQIGESLKPSDNRVAGLRAEIKRMPETRMKSRFLEVYGVAFGLVDDEKDDSPSKAPPKPRAGTRTGTRKEKALSGEPDIVDPDSPEGLIEYLNERTGKRFQAVPVNIGFVKARLEESSPDEIRAVVDAKAAQWGQDEAMAQFLRPATLFNRTKFAQYVGELGARQPGGERGNWWIRAGYGDESMARAAGVRPEVSA